MASPKHDAVIFRTHIDHPDTETAIIDRVSYPRDRVVHVTMERMHELTDPNRDARLQPFVFEAVPAEQAAAPAA